MLGRSLIIIGIVIAIVGVVISLGVKIPWLGKLPGDIYIQRKGLSFYFPITTSILISVILTVIAILFNKR